MEEKNQNTNEYTGEYGNIVEGAGADAAAGGVSGEKKQEPEPESSVYSYSYRDHQSEATRSGDYRAREHDHTAHQTSGPEAERSGEWSAASSDSATADTSQESGARQEGWQQADTSQEQSARQEGWQQADTSQSQSAYQQSGTQQGQSSYQQPFHNGNPEEGTSSGKSFGRFTGKKLAACVGLAVLFGVVAAICFQGVCYFSSHVLGVNLTAVDTDIAYTTDNVNYTNAATDTAIGTADVSGIAQQTMPSIVSITSTAEGEGGYDLFGQYYQGQDTTSAGTGFIVGKNDSELLIATNNHVVSGAKAISVQFIDEEVYSATTKGNDSAADLAVVAVKLKNLKSSTLKAIRVAALGDSSECKVGEMVVAIGNALGYGQSVTVGYVSAKDREITEDSEDGSSQASGIKVIQTDAAINPGNSGGPLLNMRGEVIGINSAKIAASAVEGVGYSIPISEANPIIDELMNREVLTDAQKGYLGISGQTVTEEASNFNMPEGVYVSEVAEGGAADQAGIKKGDIITAINDITVTTIESLKEKANSYKKGTKVTITLQRSNDGSYEEQKLEVTLQGENSLNSLEEDSGADNNKSSDNKQDSEEVPGEGDSDSEDSYDGFGSWGDLFPGFGN